MSSVTRLRKVPKAAPATDPIGRALSFVQSVQSAEGSWKNDYSGPMFLLPGYVFAHHITQTEISAAHRREILRYIESKQNPDGGFGLHVESSSYLFTTVLNYVALRLLGRGKGEPQLARARLWIHEHGGAAAIPTWGKIWLSLLRLYDYRGLNAVLPELWLLPDWFPLHPGKMWCHTRVIYLPVSYLYARRWQCADDAVLAELRDELYDRPFAEVDFAASRDLVAKTDLFVPHTPLLKALNAVSNALDPLVPRQLREKALALTIDHVKHENTSTSFFDIGPVNKALDVVANYAAEPNSEHTRLSIEALENYLFEAEEGGLFMQSYSSCELWDTAFMLQAMAETGRVEGDPALRAMAERAFAFVDEQQVRENVDRFADYYRDPSKGGWPFSTRAHGWPISDCTAEGLKTALVYERTVSAPIAKERLLDGVDLLLFWQNADGGWATYEKRRGNRLLEWINPAEMFGEIMTDYSHVECTSASVQSLLAMQRRYGRELGLARRLRVRRAIKRGESFLRSAQRPDGSWEGFWGICFTYGTWFGTWGLLDCGANASDPSIARAVEFLLAKQLQDGGWGESYESCTTGEYRHHPAGGRPSMTAWALLALIKSQHPAARAAIERGVHFLIERQQPNGDWPDEGMNGVFNKTCMLKYRFYRNYFPIWALALAEKHGFSLQ